MTLIKLVAWLLLAAPLIALAPRRAAADAADSAAPEPIVKSLPTPEAPLGEGEIRLVGTVRLVHAARGSFVLDVVAFSLPSGRSHMLAKPRSKLVLVSPQTLLNTRGDAPSKLVLEELKAGTYISAVGVEQGQGKELPADTITVLSHVPEPVGTGATGSTAEAGPGDEFSLIEEVAAAPADGKAPVDDSAQSAPPAQPDENWELAETARQRSKVLRLAQSKVKFPYFSGGTARQKIVALTFDDGPDPLCTPRILDILKREKVPATFFVIGSKAEKYPELVLRAAAEGHDIGNHTYHHFQVTSLDSQDWRFEIEQTNAVIEKILGGPTRWFRAPGCHYTEESLRVLQSLKMVRVDTTANSGDSNGTGASAIVNRTLANLAPGAVILCHDRIPNTVGALPALIKAIRQRGYRIVSLADLALRAQAVPHFEPVFWPPGQGITIEGRLASGDDGY